MNSSNLFTSEAAITPPSEPCREVTVSTKLASGMRIR